VQDMLDSLGAPVKLAGILVWLWFSHAANDNDEGRSRFRRACIDQFV
jgi:hypothetical protein